MDELLKRLYEFGEFELDPAERMLRCGGTPVALTPKAFDTLWVLIQRAGHLVTKDELLKRVWADSFVEEANLARNIWTLRKALRDDEGKHRYIETVPKLGYRFVASVSERLAVPAAFMTTVEHGIGADSPISVTGADTRQTLPAAGWSKRARAAFVSGAGALLLIALVVGTTIVRWHLFANASPIDSIAVVPFDGATTGNDIGYLADGLTENTINSLSQIPGLRVVSRTTMLRYKGRQVAPQRVGRELGVRSVLLGRITTRGDVLSVQAELIDVERDTQLWGQQYERTTSDLPSVQQQIAQQLAMSLRLKLSDEQQIRLARPATEKPEAYQAYLKGRYFWNQRNESGLKKAVEYFSAAAKIDPAYALAYSGLADSYTTLGYFSYLAPIDSFPKAKAAAIRAIELDSGLAEPHTSLAYVRLYYDWDWPEAEKEFAQAISLNPNYATAHHWYSVYLTAMERPEQASAEIRRAHELDPLSLIINTDVGFELYYGRHYDEAVNQLTTTLEMQSDFPLAHLWLGRTLQEEAKYDEALAEFSKVQTAFKDWPVAIAAIGFVDGISGKRKEALSALDELERLSQKQYVTSYGVALVYAGLGDRDSAFKWLDKAYDERTHWLVWLKLDPRWDTLRADPRFAELVRRVGLVRK